ncbi:MAG: alpha/beta hydrolase [Polyangiales bacterium]
MPNLRTFAIRHSLPFARAVLKLPPAMLRAMSGGGATVRDGLTLDPQVQLLVSLRARLSPPSLGDGDIAAARAEFRLQSVAFGGAPIEVGSVTDRTVDGPGGPIRVRRYVPESPARALPMMIFAHGGGFVLGDLETHDLVCRSLCRDAGVQLLAIDYRRAPEHQCPAAIDDAIAVFHWVVTNADALDVDRARIGFGGDSAGANISAVASQLLARAGGAAPGFQLLIYPPCDRVTARASLSLFADGFILTRADIDWFDLQYAGGSGIGPEDPRRSPIFADDLSGLPPAVIVTAGFDPIRDEGEAYAHALQAAGNEVTLRRFDGFVHGFVSMAAVSESAREALREIGERLRSLAYATA